LSEKPIICIVDDDESVREGLEGLMQSHGYAALTCESGARFLASSARDQTDCLIVDMHMPGMTGLELCDRINESGARIPTIMITALHDDELRDRALGSGVLCYLTKPFDEGALLACIRSALKKR
jgi:FixJ family two-component response regulator